MPLALTALTCAALAACGGGNDPIVTSSGTTTTTAAGATATAPATPVAATPGVALAPLAGGSLYSGTLSFGDTVSLAVDRTALVVTLRFVDSRFGLAGAVTSPYTVQADGSWLADSFTAVASSGVPASLTSTRLAAVRLRLHDENGLITGSLEKLPNLKRADGSLLQGQVVATNLGAASLASIAGVYSFVRQSTGYKADGSVAAATSVGFGQLRLSADGTVRSCDGAAYSDSCAGGTTGTVAAETDQASYPGALVLTLAGTRVGRVVVAARSGTPTLSVDAYSAAADGSTTTGNWLAQGATTAAAGTALDGEWLCAQPEIDTASGQPSGRTQRNYVSVAGGVLATDTVDTDINLSANGGGLNGLFTGAWADSKAAARAFLPVSAGTAYFVGSTASNAGAASVSGVCHRLPAQAAVATYSAAPATGSAVMTITLADARPTQPAIGYDQIYYKQGRYRNTANGSTQYRKEFDDFCEASGLVDSKSKSVVPGTSKLTDPTSFTCSGTVADPSAMKSAVVGPKGLLYLTDGHHTFTSFWHAPDGGGPAVRIPVVMKGNYSADSNAVFWRKMRAARTVWLKNPDGTATTPAELPGRLGIGNGLQDDPYRSLVYFTRDIGYTQPASATEFLEFYWSEWLRAAPQNLDLSAYRLTDATSYLSAIRRAATAMSTTADSTVIGSSGLSALAMGKLPAFVETEFATLNVAVTEAKPGKLAYALAYRASLPAATTTAATAAK